MVDRPASPASPTDRAPARIAYVDDCEDEFFVLDLVLRRARYALEIHRFDDGPSLIEWVDAQVSDGEGPPDLLVIDLNLPGMDGVEILRAVAQRPALANTVRGVCTGSIDPIDRHAAEGAGAQFYVEKPLDPRAFDEICARAPGLRTERSGDVTLLTVAR